MNRKAKNKLNMYKAVEAICGQHQTDWYGVPAFGSALSQFSAKLSELEQATYQQSVSTLGVTSSKNQLKTQTVALAELVANGLRAYAAASGNQLLIGQTHFPKYDFVRGGGQSVLNLIDRVLELANAYATDLTDYGVMEQHLEDLALLRAELGEAIHQPRQAIVVRKEHTSAIEELEGVLDDLLKNHLDRMVEVMKGSAKSFWKQYKGARVIVDYKGKKPDHGDPGEAE